MAETREKPFEPRHSGGPRALAVSLSKVTRKALGDGGGKRGLAERGLIVDWPEVVGSETAAICHPLKLSFARRDRRMDGTLALRVRPGQATRLQHMEPRLIERINGYFGYRAVARLSLRQGPIRAAESGGEVTGVDGVVGGVVGGGEATPDSASPPAGDPAGERSLDPAGERSLDPALEAALARLARAIKQEN